MLNDLLETLNEKGNKIPCFYCGQNIEKGKECPHCHKNMPEGYDEFLEVRDLMINSFSSKRKLFVDEEHFMNSINKDVCSDPLIKVDEHRYHRDGLTIILDEDDTIIDVIADQSMEDVLSRYKGWLEEFVFMDIFGLVRVDEYDSYKLMFETLKDVKPIEDVYKIKNKGIEYYATLNQKPEDIYYEYHLIVVPVSEVSKDANIDEIRDAILNNGYELWGDFFLDVSFDELKDTMSYFEDSNKVS